MLRLQFSNTKEILIALAITVASTQHFFLFIFVILIVTLILPSAKKGNISSLVGGIFPLDRTFILWVVPLGIVASLLDHYNNIIEIEVLFSSKSILYIEDDVFKWISCILILSKIYIYCLIRANVSFKGSSAFHIMIAVMGIIGIYPSVAVLLFKAENLLLSVIFTCMGLIVLSITFGFFSVFVSYLASIGRR